MRKGAENDLVKRASLLRRDSVHGSFEGTIRVDEEANTITANGVQIQVIYSDNPATVDYTAFGIKDALWWTTRAAGATPRVSPSTCRATVLPVCCSLHRARVS